MSKHRGTTCALVLGLGAIVALATGPGSAQNFGGPPLAERYFRVESEPLQVGEGRTIIRGYVYNSYFLGARNVRLLVEGLGRDNQPVSKTIGHVNGDVPAEERRYFEVAAPTLGTTFRVSVLSFDWDGSRR